MSETPRPLTAHETAAMYHFHDAYAAQRESAIDFYLTLSSSDQRFIGDLVQAISAALLASSPPSAPVAQMMREALRWLTNICCGVSKDGGNDISQQEWNECIAQAKEILESLPGERGRPDETGGWQSMETAPKELVDGMAPTILLGFAPDEENYSPRSREGYWDSSLGRWSSVLDPSWTWSPQPTHWQPLPSPPAPLPQTAEDATA